MSIKAIIFDFDGTIADTAPLVLDSWQHTFRTLTGKEYDEEALCQTLGEPLAKTMARFFPGRDQEALAIYRDWQAAQGQERWALFPGMHDCLRELRDRGYRLGIVTSRTKATCERGLDTLKIGHYIEGLVTCDDTNEHKPGPGPALAGLAKMGVSADESLFIGDTWYDMACAHNAGIRAVLVGWTRSLDPETAEGINKPDFVVNPMEELLELPERL